MVDFQSRDTRRGGDTDDEDPDPEPADEPTGAAEAEESEGAGPVEGVGFAVVTVGAERTIEEDAAGNDVAGALESAGEVVTRELLDDDFDGIQRAVNALVNRRDVDVVCTIGGTGVQPADVTVEALSPLFDKTLPGVGEQIRYRCVEERGTAVVRTRATGGIIDGVPTFCLPGEPVLAATATREVVVPEAEPLAQLARLEES